MKRRLFIYAQWILIAVSASAIAAEPQRVLPDEVARVLKVYDIPVADFSAYVHEIGATDPLLAVNESVARNPASTIKLVTTYAGLKSLGPAYTWKTEAYAGGDIADSALAGDLLIKGYGDPFFVIERFWLFLRELKLSGLERIDGDLVIDDSYFNITDNEPGGFDGQPTRVYNVVPSALLVNFQAVRFKFQPDNVQRLVEIIAEPMPANLEISNQLRLVAGHCGGYQNGIAINLGDAELRDQVIFSGKYGEYCQQYSMSRTVLQAPTYTYGVFKTLWADQGGQINGGVRREIIPEGLEPFLVFPSLPLSDVIRGVNKFSNNVMARQILLTMGAEQFGAPATVDKGRAALRQILADQGLDFTEMKLDNGAGLSRETRISALNLGRVLLSASSSPYQAEFISSIALAGLDGTMTKRFNDEELTGRMHLKTGRLDDVFAMAGYVVSRSGRRFVVVGIQNSKGAHRGPGEEAESVLVRWVYEQ